MVVPGRPCVIRNCRVGSAFFSISSFPGNQRRFHVFSVEFWQSVRWDSLDLAFTNIIRDPAIHHGPYDTLKLRARV